ncbi:MAG: DUF1266 domain-containing protein [Chitinophagaceae bacterium]|nr:DUF1266 domain-containing protein [Chitinophagaceae bacterium]
MRHLRNIAYPAIFIAFATQSCNNGQSTKTNTTDSPAVKTTIAPSSETSAPESDRINNDNLTGFMLGGVYFINGFGGVYNTYSNAVDYYDATVAEMEKGFSEKIIYPYTTSQGPQIKSVLESDWKINNKEEFLKTQEWLINEGHQKEFDTLKNVIVQNGGDSADISKIDIAKLKL